MKKNFLKKQNGITLIALVVTIVVLIILAVISINAVIGENGIIRHAEKAREHQANAEAEDNESKDVLEGHLTNVIGESEGKTPIEPEPTDSKYFDFTYDEETKTARMNGIKHEYAETLKEVDIASGMVFEYYPNYIKDGEINIKDIVISKEVEYNGNIYIVTEIAYSAFKYSELTSVIIPYSVTSIGSEAFDCSGLTSVNYEGTKEQWNEIELGSN